MQPDYDRLDWVDDFVERIRPYVYVRQTDQVLIRMPNEAFKLNSTGARLLDHLLHGGSIREILKARSFDPAIPEQLHYFFNDLSRMLDSSLCEHYQSPSLTRVPFEINYIELPILSEVAVTWKCNLRCRFCYASCTCISDEGAEKDLEELSTDEIKNVLNVIRREAEVPSVSFTGGEPVLRTDLTELIHYASHDLNMRVNLITNGTLITPQRAADFKKAGLASAQVSIESPDPEIHDSLVGVRNAFKASLNGLKELKDVGIIVHPHATVCRPNLPSLTDMAAFCQAIGVDRFSLNMIIPTGRGIDPELSVRYREIKDIVLKIKSEADSRGIRFMWYSPTPVCLFNPVSHQLGNKGCSACEGLLSIDPFGRILPCSSWKEPVGNLLEEGFKHLWFGQRGEFLRQKRMAHPDCRSCPHFAVCHGACPLYFRIYGYEEIEPALEKVRKGIDPIQRSSV